jgi:hypothetical protein
MIRMKTLTTAAALALALGASGAATACEECQLNKAGTYLGQFTLLGNGTVRTWVKLDGKKRPLSLGVTFSESALTGLSETGMGPKEMPMVPYTLALPKEAKATGFDHVGLDWSPKGHLPNGVYNVPHFDVHFYLVPKSDLARITAVGKDKAVAGKKPVAKFMPAGYILPPDTEVPMMGAHAIDAAAPELRGQPFTQTFIYGYYNGTMNFMEPMITKAYLETKPNFTTKLKLPAAYPKAGWYPTRYSIRHDPVRQEYTVALEGLTYRSGAAVKPKAKRFQAKK